MIHTQLYPHNLPQAQPIRRKRGGIPDYSWYFISDIGGNKIDDMNISTIGQYRWISLRELEFHPYLTK